MEVSSRFESNALISFEARDIEQ